MSNAQHTPGPWELRPDDMGGLSSLVFPAKQPHPVAGVTGYYSGNGERLANARLIAQAPNLLEALQRLSAQCERLRMAWQLESDAERTARAVIAKVTGGAA